MKYKIFLYAYTNLNLGDDLFIHIICERYSEVEFYILCDYSKSRGLRKIPNLKIIPKFTFLDRIIAKLRLNCCLSEYISKIISRRCSSIVHIGGSIFQEPPDIEAEINEFIRRAKRKPYFIIGSNFGPFKNRLYLERYRQCFPLAADVCFRDQYSYSLFKDLANVRYAPDVVFTTYFEVSSNSNHEKTVTISVIDLSFRKDLKKYNDLYRSKISDICRWYIDNDYVVNLVGFCKYEYDDIMIEKIFNDIPYPQNRSISKTIYSGNINKILDIFSNSEIIIGTRFHSIILGFCLRKKVLPIIYNEKTINLLVDVGFCGEHIDISKMANFDAREIAEIADLNNPIDIAAQTRESIKQFMGLDKEIQNSLSKAVI